MNLLSRMIRGIEIGVLYIKFCNFNIVLIYSFNYSENLDMEVDGVDGSPCDSKSQQQQLVRANKTNSLAMEVT